jgi:hypothetical protein
MGRALLLFIFAVEDGFSVTGKVVLGDNAQNVVLRLVQGSDRRFKVRWKGSDGSIVPIQSVAGRILDDDGGVLLADFATVSTIQPDGTVDVAILGSATTSMELTNHGKWSFRATSTSGEIKTLAAGSVIVKGPEE